MQEDLRWTQDLLITMGYGGRIVNVRQPVRRRAVADCGLRTGELVTASEPSPENQKTPSESQHANAFVNGERLANPVVYFDQQSGKSRLVAGGLSFECFLYIKSAAISQLDPAFRRLVEVRNQSREIVQDRLPL